MHRLTRKLDLIVRYYKKKLSFFLNKWIYIIQYNKLPKFKKFISLLIEFIKKSIFPVVVPFLIFWFLNSINLHKLVEILANNVDWNPISERIPAFLSNKNLNGFIPRFPIVKNDDFKTYLGISISLIGVILGLFFASISGVITTAFSKVEDSIKNIFLNNPAFKLYLKILYTALGHSLISYYFVSALGFISQYNVYFSFILTIVSIYSFTRIATNIFSDFYVSKLLDEPIYNLNQIIRNVTYKGYKFDDPNFQNFQNRSAKNETKNIELLKAYLIKNYEDEYSKEDFIIKLIALIYHYLSIEKQGIPMTSLWFEKINIHNNWFFADHTKTSVALNTGTQLLPEIKSDLDWLENRLISIIEEILITIKDHNILLSIIISFAELKERVGCLNNSKSLNILDDVIYNIIVSKNDLTDLEMMQYIESFCHIFLKQTVGFIHYLDSIEPEKKLHSITKSIKSGDLKIYEMNLDSSSILQLENLIKKINFERESGIGLSADYFILNKVKLILVESMLNTFVYLYDETLKYLLVKIVELNISKQYYKATQISLGVWEIINKFEFLISKIDKRIQAVVKQDIEQKSLLRYQEAVLSLEQTKTTISNLFRENIIKIKPSDKLEIPDTYGQIFCILALEAEKKLINNNSEEFKNLFEVLFVSAYSMFESIKKHGENINPNIDDSVSLTLATQPVYYLMAISGFAKIYSELFNNNKNWLAVKEIWDTAKSIDNKEVDRWKAIFSIKKKQIQMYPSDTFFHSWRLHLRNKLIEMGVTKEGESYGYYRSPEPNHDSHLIKYIAKHEMSLSSGEDIFVSLCEFWNDDELEKMNWQLTSIKKAIYERRH